MFGQPILLGQFQNNFGLENKHGKTCPFSLQIGNRISAKNISLQFFTLYSPVRSCAEE